MAPRWPHVGPRCPQDAPKTGHHSPKMALSMPTMAQEGLLQRRCHNKLNLTSPTSCLLHTSRAKTPFSRCQDGPKTLPNGPKTCQDRPKMVQDSLRWPQDASRWQLKEKTSYQHRVDIVMRPFFEDVPSENRIFINPPRGLRNLS